MLPIYFDQIVHQFREMRSDIGSICGIIALYLALFDTILTKSQLKKMTYESMRETIFSELQMEASEDMSDRELLELHYKSESKLLFFMRISLC